MIELQQSSSNKAVDRHRGVISVDGVTWFGSHCSGNFSS